MYYLVVLNGVLIGKTWTHEALTGENHIPITKELYDVPLDMLYLKNGQVKIKLNRPGNAYPYEWDIKSEQWVLDLAQMKKQTSLKIDQACKTAIVSGFVSYALGQPHHYPSKETDRQNLAESILASYDPDNAPDWTTPFWCSDAAGEWDFRPHAAAQIREAGRDAKTAIIAYQFKNKGLQADISAATTVEQLDAINW